MKRFVIVLLTSFAINVYADTSQDIISIINTLGYIDGYEAYLQTGTFSPPPSSERSEGYINNYHDGYFRSVEEYNLGYDVGFALGQHHHQQGWTKKAVPILNTSSTSLPDGASVAIMKGLKTGYDDGYLQSIDNSTSPSTDSSEDITASLSTDTTTDTSTDILTDSLTTNLIDTPAQYDADTQQAIALYTAISKNKNLQAVLNKMQTVQHNDRCAEGVICILSALLGEDIRKYNDWSQLQTNSGYPIICSDDMINMLSKCGVFKEVDPNSPPKAFRVLDIQYANGMGGHNEMLGPDGNWYSDGREYEGAILYDSTPKYVQAFDLDIPAYLSYLQNHTDSNPSYVQPFPAFFDANPNASPYNDIYSLFYGY